MKFKGASSNARVRSSNPRVASSNPQVMSSNPRVTSSNSWVTSCNSLVTSSNPRVTSSDTRLNKSIKNQVNNLKSSSFPKILSPKLLVRQLGLLSGDNLLFYAFTTSLLRLQEEAVWVNINFERRNLDSPQKIHAPPMILEKLLFEIKNKKWRYPVRVLKEF